MKKVKLGLVGIGAVGTELIKVLRQRDFPASEIRILARSERDEEIAGELFHVCATTPEAFEGLDLALFAGTEGAKGAARQFGSEAVRRGCVVVDNGDDFRMEADVPLVIPEINVEALNDHHGLVANPNCSTIIALMGLAPLHRVVPIRRVIAVTFQSVSGTGRAAIEELEQQTREWAKGEPPAHNVYPKPISFNVLPQIGSGKPGFPGFTSEEVKMLRESRKILGAPDLKVSATCARVPVFYAHAMALHVEFAASLEPERAREILAQAPGVVVRDDLENGEFPTPLDVQHGDEVQVGRIRKDPTLDHGLALWVVGDNIRKGAALNAVQIAEELMRRNLLSKER